MSAAPDYHFSHYFPMTSEGPGWFSHKITLPMLKEAYWHGIFPWPGGEGFSLIPWEMPSRRGMIMLEDFHIPHTVARQMKKRQYELRIDTVFGEVIRNCAARNDGDDTWITSEIIRAYQEFHEAGWAHSFEMWNRETGRLAGGLYGVSIGGIFAGESMFYRESGASKLALAALGLTLRQCGVTLLDTQMVTPTTELFGATYRDNEFYQFVLKDNRSEPLSAEALRAAAVVAMAGN